VPYLSLSVDLEGRDPGAAEDACFEAGALSVTLTDAVDDAILEPAPGELRLWPRTVLQVIFDIEAEGSAAVLQLAAALELPASAIRVQRIEDKVWEREWLKDFHAMRFGRRLWIVPRHEPLPVDAEAVCVRLDPGLAFGTGTHPSTALCLRWLDGQLLPGDRVIDYGCGSGVLAIAAAKLGAAQCHAYDIDPQAGIATHDNAIGNGVSGCIQLHAEPGTLPGDADVLLANIISGILCELSPRFAQLLRPGARLVLAGILDEQVESVVAAYSPWIVLEPFARRDGWTALSGTRRQDA
jgi:ribosomal protein L11 methyltransferase